MEHIFKMGEGTAALNRQYSVGRDTFLAMASIYQGMIYCDIVAPYAIAKPST